MPVIISDIFLHLPNLVKFQRSDVLYGFFKLAEILGGGGGGELEKFMKKKKKPKSTEKLENIILYEIKKP